MSSVTWNLDPAHSEVTFRVRHLMVTNVSGRFKSFNATVTTEGDDLSTAQVEFTIDAASIETGVEARDNHLRSDDFFNAESFPTIRFTGKGLAKSQETDGYYMDGELTVRDTTKPMRLEVDMGGVVTDPYGQVKAGFEVEGKIKRKEFGLRWDAFTEAGGAVVSDEVRFQVNVQFVKVLKTEEAAVEAN